MESNSSNAIVNDLSPKQMTSKEEVETELLNKITTLIQYHGKQSITTAEFNQKVAAEIEQFSNSLVEIHIAEITQVKEQEIQNLITSGVLNDNEAIQRKDTINKEKNAAKDTMLSDGLHLEYLKDAFSLIETKCLNKDAIKIIEKIYSKQRESALFALTQHLVNLGFTDGYEKLSHLLNQKIISPVEKHNMEKVFANHYENQATFNGIIHKRIVYPIEQLEKIRKRSKMIPYIVFLIICIVGIPVGINQYQLHQKEVAYENSPTATPDMSDPSTDSAVPDTSSTDSNSSTETPDTTTTPTPNTTSVENAKNCILDVNKVVVEVNNSVSPFIISVSDDITNNGNLTSSTKHQLALMKKALNLLEYYGNTLQNMTMDNPDQQSSVNNYGIALSTYVSAIRTMFGDFSNSNMVNDATVAKEDYIALEQIYSSDDFVDW